MLVEAIVCFDILNGISKDSKLPWLADKIGDLEYVRLLTTSAKSGKKNIIIVGSKTARTLPDNFTGPETNRELCVLTRRTSTPKKLYHHLLDRYYTKGDIDKVIVFGGGEIYNAFIDLGIIHKFYITKIDKDYKCDTFFPMDIVIKDYTCSTSSCRDNKGRTFSIWDRNCHPEYNYLELLKKVYYSGSLKTGRNGDTYSIFGETVEFDIATYGFPLLTTKKMFFRGIAEELFWFLKADTNTNHLKDKGVHIWDGNTTREYLDSIGLTSYPTGIAGPIYGYQWRTFNGPYINGELPTLETSRDQLFHILRELKENPTSRRIIFSGWNPNMLNEMCLPPCHVLYQFYVIDGRLNCQMYQRSADLFLGLPFNIASTALLTSIFASMTDLRVGKIRICIGDAHIYKEHAESVLEQITRKPLGFSKLVIKDIKTKLEDWTYNDISLDGYNSHSVLKASMKA
jgi:thymidylate synthase/dihydrofolate reductase